MRQTWWMRSNCVNYTFAYARQILLRKMKRFLVLGSVSLLIIACTQSEDEVYTLYRNSIVNPSMRIHVATFNAVDGEAYNNENCSLAVHLFQAQPEIATKFWCEKGNYRK